MLLLVTMQWKAALWILGAFNISPTSGIKALVGLIPIQLHLEKLVKRSCLRTATLPLQHALMSLLSAKHTKGAPPYPQSTFHLSPSFILTFYILISNPTL